MDIKSLKQKLRKYFDRNYRVLSYEGGYCSTCAYSEDVVAMDQSTFEDMLNEIDEWSKEQFGDKNGSTK